MDVSMRLLEYFVAVAEELNVTRAAQRLYVAQPALSKAIQRLEVELGMPLFTRSRQGVALTSTGHSLLPVARTVLDDFDVWLRTARLTQQAAARVITVGYHSSTGADLVKPITEGFRRLCPDWQLKLRLVDWYDPAGAVLNGDAQAALLRLPVPGQEHLVTETLRRDRRWVALPADHALTARDTVRLRDLRQEPFIALPAASGPFRDFWLAIDQFDEAPPVACEVDNAEDYFQAILAGRGVALLAESSTHVYPRPGITYRLVEDATRSELAVVWRADSDFPVLREFVRSCLDAVGRTIPGQSR